MYSFGEKGQEKNKAGVTVEVWKLPKYEQSKRKAIEIIEKYDGVEEGDFWILKNETKSGGIMYSGLIASHNACLKINDTLAEKNRFKPECITVDKEGFGGSLVYTYCSPEQGIYEVGEASAKNCKNPYPYAMAFKRCFDRVVLKASKLAYDGIYSESESDDFKQDVPASKSKPAAHNDIDDAALKKVTSAHLVILNQMIKETDTDTGALLDYYGVDELKEMSEAQYGDALNLLKRKKDSK